MTVPPDSELDLTGDPPPPAGPPALAPFIAVEWSPTPDSELDVTGDPLPPPAPPVELAPLQVVGWSPTRDREEVRGVLARGLLWLLTFAIGGVMAFIGLGLLDGTVLTQSVFPSIVALAGTALGFYFGSQTAQGSDPSTQNHGDSTKVTS